MTDYTFKQNRITADFTKAVMKRFKKMRYGISEAKGPDYDLATLRYELLKWQLLPGTDRTLFSDATIYPVDPLEVISSASSIAAPAGSGAAVSYPTIIEIVDDIPDFG